MTTQTREIIDRKGTSRRYTDEGFLVVPAKIARTGIQEYRAFELGIGDGDPLRIVRIYRAPEQVFDPEAIASFENKPVTDNHPEEFVDASNWKDLAKGFARNVRREGDYLVADLIVTDRDAIDKIVAGKVELSNGYGAIYDMTPGTTPGGQAYDGQQTNIRGNHVAIVDAARCGPTCRVSDSPTHPPKGKPMADRKVTIDGIPFELPEAAAAAVDKLIGAHDAAVSASQTAAQALAAAETKHAEAIAAKDAELESLRKDVITPDARDALVETWAKLIADAKRLVSNFDHKGKTCDAIRREVVAKLAEDEARKPMIDAALAGVPVKDATADAVRMAFAVLAAIPGAAGTTDGSTDPVAAALRNQDAAKDEAKPTGRDAYTASVTDAWKNQPAKE